MYAENARNKRRAVGYIIAFALMWLGVGALIGWIAAYTLGRRAATPPPVASNVLTGVLIAAALAALTVAFTLRSGTRLVLSIAGARVADPQTYPQLCNFVQALALGDGLPIPAVYVIEDISPNAFATGVSPAHAAVTVTTGLLAVMDREQLEGVLRHELSHIKNYDTRLLLIVTLPLGMAGLAASVGWRSAFSPGTRPRRPAAHHPDPDCWPATGSNGFRRRTDHPPRPVAPSRVARRRQQRRTHPQPCRTDPGPSDPSE